MLDTIAPNILELAIRLGAAALIYLLGRWLARTSRKWLGKVMPRTALTPSMIRLTQVLAYYSILLLTILTALAMVGVPINALLAGGAVVIVILGIALQQSLANLAATIIFLLFQPFRVGELVETNGIMGTVNEIQFFNTVINTYDNKVITIPNSKIQDNNLVNYTRLGRMMVDLPVSISYSDDLRKAKAILLELAVSDERVLKEPPPAALVKELGDNGVNLAVRAWTTSGDYWGVQFTLREQIKLRFDEEGIVIPFPQRDLHIIANTHPAHSA